MKLDYNPSTGAFLVKVPRSANETINDLMRNHGLDFSIPASTPSQAVLFTKEPYAALTFIEDATPAAQEQLAPLAKELAASWASESQGHFDVPADRELWPYQKAGLSYMLRRTDSLDGDEPGLGKTPTAIVYANEIRAKKIVVICPASIRLQWVKRIREWSTLPWPLTIHPIISSRNGVHPNAHWTVLSYELARQPSIYAALMRDTYDLLILDEAHYLKTASAARTRAVFDFPDGNGLASRFGSKIALTGTPLPNRPREAYVLMRGLCLAADTLVLTDRGAVPIVDVQITDRLWDGNEWVTHTGLAFNGRKNVLRTQGVGMTPEHRVLSGGTWTTWSNVLANESIRSRALATGSESLQYLATHTGREAFALPFNAPVEVTPIALRSTTREVGRTDAAKAAEIECSGELPNGGRAVPQTGASVSFSCLGSAQSLGAAKSQRTPATPGTGAEASGCGRSGLSTEGPSSIISSISPTAVEKATNSTGGITAGGTSPKISAGLPERSMQATNAPSLPWSGRTESCEPVYDIMNAGPNHRFTILTWAGPLVVHNCWDAIDWMSENAFGERFNPRVKREVGRGNEKRTYIDERTGRHAELQNRLRVNMMTRHLKREVMTQLKLPVYDLIQVDESGPVKLALQAENMLQIDPETLEGADAMVLGEVATVRRLMGVAMAPQVCDHVDMLIEGGEEKIVLFGWHTQVLDIYEHRLHKHGVVRVDGGTGAAEKDRLVQQFQADPETKLIIGNLLSLGTGTDGLQNVCNHALIGEPDWTPGNNIQAFDRLDRGGQTRTVLGEIFVAPNSFAERVLASSLRKLSTINRSLDKRGYDDRSQG